MSEEQGTNPTRRSFLGAASTAAMAGGLLAGYGTFFGYAGRYLYPAKPDHTSWMFVIEIDRLEVGASMNYTTPAGGRVVITRRAAEEFKALSSTCPHLGCQVHWEPQNARFFCPCHNGVFSPEGKGIGGPPGEAKQDLPEYPLKVEHGLLYIEVPTAKLARSDGHDPCLKGTM
ncbi:MAG: QcrA and Rieske domain-containing protein [Planctomycetota bacterium]|jgi:Rieske Fe-S protein